jgi:hypothetical protein
MNKVDKYLNENTDSKKALVKKLANLLVEEMNYHVITNKEYKDIMTFIKKILKVK